jgi:hypothetical protein
MVSDAVVDKYVASNVPPALPVVSQYASAFMKSMLNSSDIADRLGSLSSYTDDGERYIVAKDYCAAVGVEYSNDFKDTILRALEAKDLLFFRGLARVIFADIYGYIHSVDVRVGRGSNVSGVWVYDTDSPVDDAGGLYAGDDAVTDYHIITPHGVPYGPAALSTDGASIHVMGLRFEVNIRGVDSNRFNQLRDEAYRLFSKWSVLLSLVLPSWLMVTCDVVDYLGFPFGFPDNVGGIVFGAGNKWDSISSIPYVSYPSSSAGPTAEVPVVGGNAVVTLLSGYKDVVVRYIPSSPRSIPISSMCYYIRFRWHRQVAPVPPQYVHLSVGPKLGVYNVLMNEWVIIAFWHSSAGSPVPSASLYEFVFSRSDNVSNDGDIIIEISDIYYGNGSFMKDGGLGEFRGFPALVSPSSYLVRWSYLPGETPDGYPVGVASNIPEGDSYQNYIWTNNSQLGGNIYGTVSNGLVVDTGNFNGCPYYGSYFGSSYSSAMDWSWYLPGMWLSFGVLAGSENIPSYSHNPIGYFPFCSGFALVFFEHYISGSGHANREVCRVPFNRRGSSTFSCLLPEFPSGCTLVAIVPVSYQDRVVVRGTNFVVGFISVGDAPLLADDAGDTVYDGGGAAGAGGDVLDGGSSTSEN